MPPPRPPWPPRAPASSPSTCRTPARPAPPSTGSSTCPPTSRPRTQVRAAVARASDDPARPLRTVVNCAGIGPSARILGRKGVHDLALFRKVVEINLVGSFTVLAVAAEAIAATEPDADGQRGVVINTASIAAFDGQVGQAAYSSSKGGIVGLTLPGRPRPGAVRHPGHDHRPRHRRDPDARDRVGRVPRRRWPPASRSRSGSRALRSTPSSRWRSSTTTTSTARRSGWTAPCGWPRADPRRPDAAHPHRRPRARRRAARRRRPRRLAGALAHRGPGRDLPRAAGRRDRLVHPPGRPRRPRGRPGARHEEP